MKSFARLDIYYSTSNTKHEDTNWVDPRIIIEYTVLCLFCRSMQLISYNNVITKVILYQATSSIIFESES